MTRLPNRCIRCQRFIPRHEFYCRRDKPIQPPRLAVPVVEAKPLLPEVAGRFQ